MLSTLAVNAARALRRRTPTAAAMTPAYTYIWDTPLTRGPAVFSSAGKRSAVDPAATAVTRTRLGSSCAPGGQTPLDGSADAVHPSKSLESIAIDDTFREKYAHAAGRATTCTFPATGHRSRPVRGAQLQALAPDPIAAPKG
jgi:hypothetical protein